jgi:hypothetical protein
VFSFFVITGLIAIIALNTRFIGKSITLVLSAIAMTLVLIGIEKYLKTKNLSK